MRGPRVWRTGRAAARREGRSCRWCLLPVLAIACSSACATARFVIPADSPTPRPDGAAPWDQVSQPCRSVEHFAGEFRASGRVSGERVAGLRLGLALTRDGHVAVEGRVSSTLFFSLRGSPADATLVLFQERRIVSGRADELLDALVALPIGPERLLDVLAGCVSDGPASSGESVGRFVRVRAGDSLVYLVEQDGRWRARAGTFAGLIVDYDYQSGNWPSRVRLTTEAGRTPAVELTLVADTTDTEPRNPSVFVVRVPDGFERVTTDWVRENGPLRRR